MLPASGIPSLLHYISRTHICSAPKKRDYYCTLSGFCQTSIRQGTGRIRNFKAGRKPEPKRQLRSNGSGRKPVEAIRPKAIRSHSLRSHSKSGPVPKDQPALVKRVYMTPRSCRAASHDSEKRQFVKAACFYRNHLSDADFYWVIST